MVFNKVSLNKLKPVKFNSLNTELQWLSQCLGLFNKRDKSSSCFRIFIELLKNTKLNKPLSSDEIAYRLHLSRGTVVHHLNRLIDSGLVISIKNKYQLSDASLRNIIENLKNNVESWFETLETVAEDIDKKIK